MNKHETFTLTQTKIRDTIIAICCSCKKIRDETGHWRQIKGYQSIYSGARVSHGICRKCAAILSRQPLDSFK